MKPFALSGGGVAASLAALAACGVGDGAAYVPSSATSAAARRGGGRRSNAMTVATSAASDPGGGEGTNEKSSSTTGPPSYPRLGASPLPYVRIKKRGRRYDVQTAVTTFRKSDPVSAGVDAPDNNPAKTTTTTVDLHAQIHFGDASYFRYFDEDAAFSSRYDKVLYELIVEEKFLARSSDAPSLKQLTPMPGSDLNPIAPTQSDRSTANQYGLQCQVDGIRYCQEGWVHADLTREEFLGLLEQGERQKERSQLFNNGGEGGERPLWALASTAATYPGSELVTSLLRPLTATSNSASAALTRRLFTHLFLPGDALSGWIRAALWLGVPSPELSIMLVDWSSLSYVGRRRRGGAEGGGGESNIAPISPIAAPVLLSLLTGNWGTARRLVFGQVLADGQSSADGSRGGVLIDRRNERAVDVLREWLSSSEDGGEEDATCNGRRRVALLYGAGHCRDLHRRLVRDEGMTPVRTEWRTAFRATAPRWGDFGVDVDDWRERTSDLARSALPSSIADDGVGVARGVSDSTLESVAVGLVVLPLYLLVGGFDWVSTLADLGNAVDGGVYLDGTAAVLLYLVRHVALYVGISKFVVDWGGNEGIFEDDERA